MANFNGMYVVPIDEMIRLLMALAGGEDGDTFVFVDSMQMVNKTLARIEVSENSLYG